MTELGNRLKEAREAKGMSLDDLQRVTKIQKRYLTGIEEGKYDMMPGKFYVRAFIKQYCEAVGLDPEEIFEQYKSDVPVVYNEDLPNQLSRVQSRKIVPSRDSKFIDLLPKILVGLFIIGTVVLIYVLIAKNVNTSQDKPKDDIGSETVNYGESKNSPLKNEKKGEEPAKKEQPEKQKEQKQVTKEPAIVKQELTSVSTSGKNSTYQLKNADKFTLKVSSSGSTWVNIKNGSGKSFYQGTLNRSQSQEINFTNETAAVLIIGNAADTDIFVNGEKLEYSISPVQTVTQNVTIQFAKAQ
ncbi:helix-turn-helix domain-containing protein [Peribacillus cavernae]|uniref:Helix-turn-helix domain-containing protein n=1 Tax=Peribacillus cavernae TaxID=1674310 RepID=A0A3S0VEJ0_9BACI|nr:RodZ domain-containing protein [Peribacillus cavernae]MDQ0217006.1 cytoskeletal protein RodZ [Peribacillus cavernae]RUQ30511.1 helix-turn-helix domain-containing protein [Peribacillus cavernae]